MTGNKIITAALVASVILMAVPGLAQLPDDRLAHESRAYLHGYNLPSSGVALEGYCPVAYFEVHKPVQGKPEHARTYDGVTYWFVSGDARKAFEADPEKYVPAYGGWCAYGMAIEDKLPVDPTSFKIVDGRLMLFLRNKNVDARAVWNRARESELTARADAFWQSLKS